jgi:hypothetical protein
MKQYHITEKAVQETFVSDFPNVALLDPASLCAEVQRLTEELALSNARVSMLEAENKTLKLKVKNKRKMQKQTTVSTCSNTTRSSPTCMIFVKKWEH